MREPVKRLKWGFESGSFSWNREKDRKMGWTWEGGEVQVRPPHGSGGRRVIKQKKTTVARP